MIAMSLDRLSIQAMLPLCGSEGGGEVSYEARVGDVAR